MNLNFMENNKIKKSRNEIIPAFKHISSYKSEGNLDDNNYNYVHGYGRPFGTHFFNF